MYNSAQLQEATRTWPYSDFLSLSQRAAAVSMLKTLNKSLSTAVSSLQETDPKYFKGEALLNPSRGWGGVVILNSLIMARKHELFLIQSLSLFWTAPSGL